MLDGGHRPVPGTAVERLINLDSRGVQDPRRQTDQGEHRHDEKDAVQRANSAARAERGRSAAKHGSRDAERPCIGEKERYQRSRRQE